MFIWLVFLLSRSPCPEQSPVAQGSPEVCHCYNHQNWHFWHEDPQKSEWRLLQEDEAEEASSPGGRDLWYRKRGKPTWILNNLLLYLLLISMGLGLCFYINDLLFFVPLTSVEVPADRAEEGGPEKCWCTAPAPHQESPSDERVPALYLLPVQWCLCTQAGFLNVFK